MTKTIASPKVSVLCPTFNHEQFIATAISSFLAQRTSFLFEIIIRDDASTDRTLDIVMSYRDKYPNQIRVISHAVNQFQLGKRPVVELLRSARGEYISFCEGDDYWSDPNKLQIQIENIEADPQCIASAHKTLVLNKDGSIDKDSPLFVSRNTAQLLDYTDIATPYTPFHTTSFVCKKSALIPALEYRFFGKSFSGDLVMYSLAASQGKISFIPKYMSVYRVHDGGITKSSLHQNRVLFNINRLYMWSIINQWSPLPTKYKKHLYNYFLKRLASGARTLGAKRLILRSPSIISYTCILIFDWLSHLNYRNELKKTIHD